MNNSSPAIARVHLFDKGECPFCWKVRLGLRYKDIAYEETRIDTANKSPKFLQISDSGKVPLVVVDHEKLEESSLILLYFEDRIQHPTLLPGNPENRHRIRRLNHYADTVIGPAIRDAIFTQRGKAPEQWDLEVIEKCRNQWRECLSFLDNQLATDHYFCGEFSLADCALLPRFALAATYGLHQVEEFTRLKNWFDWHASQNYFVQTAPAVCLTTIG